MSTSSSSIRKSVCLPFLIQIDARVIAIARKYEDFATEFKGAFRVFYINCEKEASLCGKLKPEKMPSIRVYPPLPIPVVDFAIV